jgi:hypothetical protein
MLKIYLKRLMRASTCYHELTKYFLHLLNMIITITVLNILQCITFPQYLSLKIMVMIGGGSKKASILQSHSILLFFNYY